MPVKSITIGVLAVMASGLAMLAVVTTAGAKAVEGVPAGQQKREEPVDILPLVTIKPGQSTQLLLSTRCTLQITRGGGLGLAEMRDGKPVGGGREQKSYKTNGVQFDVPDFTEGPQFAAADEYAALREKGVSAFQVKIAADPDATPGMLEMHLVDATCAGHCKTNFRVLVLEP